jgi:DNA-binding NtrC family response regulator
MPTRHVIVCVDDDEDVLNAVARSLRDRYDVRATLSARDALAWIVAEEVAVLVSDYDMPEMTGAQLAGQVRNLRPDTVRILLTGQRSLETAVDGINQGEVFRFLGKPFEPSKLRTAVASAIERHEELVALSGDRQRRERRAAMHAALEAEYPGISKVAWAGDGMYVVTGDPWTEAATLGLVGLTAALER